ncbi:MAG: HAMP domain-containing protein [Treponema sp.]|jgi:class 3 adenylate cyclase/HAMP domain-containing protein|nr:HAMP domain-containing protein [Treponema sp.]
MRIKFKIILVVLPLIVITLILSQTASYVTAVDGVNHAAERFLGFKISEVRKYAENQWALLVENNYAGRADMVEAAKNAVEIYARSVVTSKTEIILAVNETGGTVMCTSDETLTASDAEKEKLLTLLHQENNGVMSVVIGGQERVFRAFYFTPFNWYVLLTERRAVFYSDVDRITAQTIFVTLAAACIAVVLLVVFSSMLTKPLAKATASMDAIIKSGDMSERVEVVYRDETGALAQTFNAMITGLEAAYRQIKKHAFDAVMAQKREHRIRRIFQKYVPKDVIDKFFVSPDSMLVGDNRNLSILFSDIRGFTTISEGMKPDRLVSSLNRYFSGQVDIIMDRNGVVDKYIGDAIMAFWGAPVSHEDDAMQSVLAGLDMIDALKTFNEKQRELGEPEFHIGVGVNYGVVTVGNIGSERKMDYTVIGDTVNLASRMEGLTKMYHAELLISEPLYNKIGPQLQQERLSARLLDTVAVKGKTKGVKIFTVKRDADDNEKKAWSIHNQGVQLYYQRSFANAAACFQKVLVLLPDDFNAKNLLVRAQAYTKDPPPENWNGIEVMHSK